MIAGSAQLKQAGNDWSAERPHLMAINGTDTLSDWSARSGVATVAE